MVAKTSLATFCDTGILKPKKWSRQSETVRERDRERERVCVCKSERERRRKGIVCIKMRER